MVDGVGGSEVLIGEGATLLPKLLRFATSAGLRFVDDPFDEADNEVEDEEVLGGNMARLNRSITTSWPKYLNGKSGGNVCDYVNGKMRANSQTRIKNCRFRRAYLSKNCDFLLIMPVRMIDSMKPLTSSPSALRDCVKA